MRTRRTPSPRAFDLLLFPTRKSASVPEQLRMKVIRETIGRWTLEGYILDEGLIGTLLYTALVKENSSIKGCGVLLDDGKKGESADGLCKKIAKRLVKLYAPRVKKATRIESDRANDMKRALEEQFVVGRFSVSGANILLTDAKRFYVPLYDRVKPWLLSRGWTLVTEWKHMDDWALTYEFGYGHTPLTTAPNTRATEPAAPLPTLKDLLDKAVIDENYEAAADLRDAMNAVDRKQPKRQPNTMKAFPVHLVEIHLDQTLLAIQSKGYVAITRAARVVGIDIPERSFEHNLLRIYGTMKETKVCLEEVWHSALSYVATHPQSVVSVADSHRQIHVFTFDDLPALRKNAH